VNCCTHDNVLPGVTRELRGLQPQACGKKNRISIASASSLSLPCTRSFNVRLLGEGALCCCCARPSSRVTNKADRMRIPFRGAHAPAVQGADAACISGARGGRVSGAHEQPPTADAATCMPAAVPSHVRFRLSAAARCLPTAGVHPHRISSLEEERISSRARSRDYVPFTTSFQFRKKTDRNA